MGSVKTLNPNADVMGRHAATFMCVNAAKGLHEVSIEDGIKALVRLCSRLSPGAGSASQCWVDLLPAVLCYCRS
jgi:hypothetical protein